MASTLEYPVLNTLVNKCQITGIKGYRNRLLSQLVSLHPTAHYYAHHLYGYEIWGNNLLLLS